jgi:hypothetical protein
LSDVILASRILELIRAFQNGTGAARHGWQQELACRFDAVPVYSDLGGALLLRPDGKILRVGWEDEEKAEPADQRWSLMGRVAAAEFFPELRALAPSPPASADNCPNCGGAGLERWWVEGVKGVTFCGRCCGLGWLTEAATDTEQDRGVAPD